MGNSHGNGTRWFAALLSACLIWTSIPITARAENVSTDDGLCPHHTEHTAECGYAPSVEGSECAHVHDESCGYAEESACLHEHTPECTGGGGMSALMFMTKAAAMRRLRSARMLTMETAVMRRLQRGKRARMSAKSARHRIIRANL